MTIDSRILLGASLAVLLFLVGCETPGGVEARAATSISVKTPGFDPATRQAMENTQPPVAQIGAAIFVSNERVLGGDRIAAATTRHIAAAFEAEARKNPSIPPVRANSDVTVSLEIQWLGLGRHTPFSATSFPIGTMLVTVSKGGRVLKANQVQFKGPADLPEFTVARATSDEAFVEHVGKLCAREAAVQAAPGLVRFFGPRPQ